MIRVLMLEKYRKTSWQRRYTFDLCMAISTLILPFFIYLHLLFDDESLSINAFGFEYYHTFVSNQAFAWYVISNTISLTILILILINSRGRWRLFLLPIIGNFFCTLLYGFSSSESYLLFLLDPIGIIFLTMVVTFVFILDKIVKSNIQREFMIPSGLILNELMYSYNRRYNSRLKSLLNDKSKLSLKEYVFRIYHLSQLVNIKYDYSTFNERFGLSTNGYNGSDFLLGLLTLIISLFLFVDNLIPSETQILNLGGIIISDYGFYDVKTFLWFTSQKFTMCLLSIIWLLTSKNWWRWAILSPIIFYSYQFWESFQPVDSVDGSGNLNVFPLVLLTILRVFLLSRVIRRISINLDYQTFLEEELDKSIGELSRLERDV